MPLIVPYYAYLLCFLHPSPRLGFLDSFFHPLAFFPPLWFVQFLHLLLGLESPLTACARLPALCSIWPSWPQPWGKVQVPELGVFSVLVAVECKEMGLKTGSGQQQVFAGSSSGPWWKCFTYWSRRCVFSEVEAAIFVQHRHTAAKGHADCTLGTVLTL